MSCKPGVVAGSGQIAHTEKARVGMYDHLHEFGAISIVTIME
jgi:hypothetical protein